MPEKIELLYRLFLPMSPIYAAIMKVREQVYKKGWIAAHHLDVPVISVGNLTMGGSGKTPFVIFLAKHFQSMGYRPAVISRGYKGKAKEPVNIVSDFEKIHLTASQAGDEPRMMAENLPGIPVITATKRVLGCRYAADTLDCDLLLLDDGFQHLAVQRKVDLVLFPSANLLRNYHVFPGGVLRESFSALNRCDAIFFTGFQEQYKQNILDFVEVLHKRGIKKPCFFCWYGKLKIKKVLQGVKTEETGNHEHNLYAFTGIANPERFFNTLKDQRVDFHGFSTFPDHYAYTENDIQRLVKLAQKKKNPALITTEKDLVKLSGMPLGVPLYSAVPEFCIRKKRLNLFKAWLPVHEDTLPLL